MSNRTRRQASRLDEDCRGSVAVEFAFVGLIFFTLLLGAVDLARYQFMQQSLRSMAGEAARQAMIISSAGAVAGGPCATAVTAGQLRTAVTTPTNPTPMLAIASLTLNPVCTASGGVRTVTVTATYPFTFVVPFLPALTDLTTSAALSY